MQIHHIGYQVKGFYRAAALATRWNMTTEQTTQRLKILNFFDAHGAAATCDAFDLSTRTLHRWRRALRIASGNIAALASRSRAPKKRRQSNRQHSLPNSNHCANAATSLPSSTPTAAHASPPHHLANKPPSHSTHYAKYCQNHHHSSSPITAPNSSAHSKNNSKNAA